MRNLSTARQQVVSLFAQERKTVLLLPTGLVPGFEEDRRVSYIEVDKDQASGAAQLAATHHIQTLHELKPLLTPND